VKAFRDSGDAGATASSRSLLHWWILECHLHSNSDGVLGPYAYFFAQGEAIETILFLVDVAGAQNEVDLLHFDGSGELFPKLFDESWLRLLIKMATGSGKTKVLSLVIARCFVHKLHEPASTLDRDFTGLRIFFTDPILPPNGFDGRSWSDDVHNRLADKGTTLSFQLALSAMYSERYADSQDLGVIEGRKASEVHRKGGQKGILFVMSDDTHNCDVVAAFLENTCSDLKKLCWSSSAKKMATSAKPPPAKPRKNWKELERQRRPANAIDHDDNPYKAIASVLMFKEGWDGGDVTTIVGPRAFSSNSAILPGQILGRAPMAPGGGGTTPLAIESDRDHPSKDLAALDIPLPILSPQVVRQPNALTALALEAILFQPLPWLTGPTPPHPKKRRACALPEWSLFWNTARDR